MNGGLLAAVLILVLHPPPADAATTATCDSSGGGGRYTPGSAYEASLRRVADALPTVERQVLKLLHETLDACGLHAVIAGANFLHHLPHLLRQFLHDEPTFILTGTT